MDALLVVEDRDEVKSICNKAIDALKTASKEKKVGLKSLLGRQNVRCDKTVFVVNELTRQKHEQMKEWIENVLSENDESNWLLIYVERPENKANNGITDLVASRNVLAVTSLDNYLEWWPRMLTFLCVFSTLSLVKSASFNRCCHYKTKNTMEETCSHLKQMFQSIANEQMVSSTIGNCVIVVCDTPNRQISDAMKTDLRKMKCAGKTIVFHSLNSDSASNDIKWVASHYFDILGKFQFLCFVLGYLGLIKVDRTFLVNAERPKLPPGPLKISRSGTGIVLNWNQITDMEDSSTLISLQHQKPDTDWMPLAEVEKTATTFNVPERIMIGPKHRFSLTVVSNSGCSNHLISEWYDENVRKLNALKVVKKILFLPLLMLVVILDFVLLVVMGLVSFGILYCYLYPAFRDIYKGAITSEQIDKANRAVFYFCIWFPLFTLFNFSIWYWVAKYEWVSTSVYFLFMLTPDIIIFIWGVIINRILYKKYDLQFGMGIFSLPGYFLKAICNQGIFDYGKSH